MRVFTKLVFFAALSLGLGVSAAFAQDTCPAIVEQALQATQGACDGTARNQACYGNVLLSAQPQAGVTGLNFDQPGDIVNMADVQTLTLSSMNTATSEWGVALLRLQTNLPDTLPGQNVTFILFGDVEMQDAVAQDKPDDYRPMQSFFFKSGVGDAPCAEAPDSGVLIQTPRGARTINFTVNDVKVELGSTAYLQTRANGQLTINVIEGSGSIEAAGETRNVPAGGRVNIPLGPDQKASGPPGEVEPYDPADVQALPVSLLPRAITIAPPLVLDTTAAVAGVGEAVLVNIEFTGDAADCPADQVILPLDVVLVIDVSGSMAGPNLASAKGSAIAFISQLDPSRDRVGVVIFDDTASVASPLGTDFDTAKGVISGLTDGGGTQIDAGLNTGYAELVANGRGGNTQTAVVLLSDGGSDPIPAQAAASSIKASGTQLFTLGVGEGTNQELLTSLASDPGDFLFAPTSGVLGDIFSETANRLVGRVAARNLEVTYRVDTRRFQLVEDFLGRGQLAGDGVIRWTAERVVENQTVTFPVVVRPLVEGTFPVGTASITYLKCLEGDETAVLPAESFPLIEAAAAAPQETVTLDDGVLTLGAAGEAELGAFEAQRWLIDIDADQMFSVVLNGTGAGLPPTVVNDKGEFLSPLYSLNNYGGVGNYLHAFRTEKPGPYWLYVQSADTQVVDYSIELAEGLQDAPPELARNQPINDQQANYEGRTYLLAGSEGDAVTVTTSYTSSNFFSLRDMRIISVEGQLSRYTYALRSDSPSSSRFEARVFTLQGSGPYRLFISGSGPYSLETAEGDTLSHDRGTFKLGETVNVTPEKPEVGLYTLDPGDTELKAGDKITISYIQSDPDSFYSSFPTAPQIRNASGESFTYVQNYSERNAYVVVQQVKGDGPYQLIVPSTMAHRLSVELGDKLTVDKGEIAVGDVVSDNPTGPQFASFTLNAAAGDTISVEVRLLNTSDSVRGLEIKDKDGAVQNAKTRIENDGLLLGLYELTGSGPYTITLQVKQSYSLKVGTGDDLTKDMGEIAAGQRRDESVSGPQFISYTLSQVKPGDTITVLYESREGHTPQDMYVQDAKGARSIQLYGNDYLNGRFARILQLTGEAPYKLVFDTVGPYNLSVDAGNTLLVVKGTLKVGDSAKDTIPGDIHSSNTKIVQYQIDAQAGQTITVKVQSGSSDYYNYIDGDLQGQRQIDSTSGSGSFGGVYTLQGAGPFSFTFQIIGSYTISVTEGNALRLDKGTLALGDVVKDNVQGGTQIVAYTLDTGSADTISVKLEIPRRDYLYTYFTVRDASGGYFYSDTSVNNEGYSASVFKLTGTPPYSLSFEINGSYTLSLVEGDILRSAKGTLRPGDSDSDNIAGSQQVVVYTLDAPPGSAVTIRLEKRNDYLYGTVRDANGNYIDSAANAYNNGATTNVYELTGTPPYTIQFEVQGSYTISVLEGDALRQDKGTLKVGESVAGASTDESLVILYTIDAQPGQMISITYTTKQRYSYIYGQLQDASGQYIYSVNNLYDDRSTTEVYQLSGTPPYKLTFQTSGEYTLSISEGDGSRVDMPPIKPGLAVEGSLGSGRQAAYPLEEVNADEELTVNVTSRSGLVEVYITNGSGSQIMPTGDPDINNRRWSFKITPTGDGPYTLFLKTEGDYSLSVLAPIDPSKGITVEVTSNSINLRTGPGTNFATAGTAARGTQFLAVGRNAAGDWSMCVNLEDQSVVWIFNQLIKPVQEGADLSALPVTQ